MNTITSSRQQGFTLIELMVAISLGLLIVAAASQLLLTGHKSLLMQNSAAEILDNGNFGLNYVTKDVRKANLGASNPVVNDETLSGGLVLAAGNVTPYVEIDAALMTRGDGQVAGVGNSWTGASNVVDKKSDQLTIQYSPVQEVLTPEQLMADMPADATAAAALKAKYTAIVVGADCAGKSINLLEVREGVHIVQRYFLRKDATASSGEPNEALALACTASRYTQDAVETEKAIDLLHKKTPTNPSTPPFTPIVLSGLDGAGQIIMNRVDHFHIVLGVATGDYDAPTDLRYMTIKDYMDLSSTPKPRVRSVQVGMIVRATGSVGGDGLVSNTPAFTVLEQTAVLKTPSTGAAKYLRQAVTQTIAFRNGLGEGK